MYYVFILIYYYLFKLFKYISILQDCSLGLDLNYAHHLVWPFPHPWQVSSDGKISIGNWKLAGDWTLKSYFTFPQLQLQLINVIKSLAFVGNMSETVCATNWQVQMEPRPGFVACLWYFNKIGRKAICSVFAGASVQAGTGRQAQLVSYHDLDLGHRLYIIIVVAAQQSSEIFRLTGCFHYDSCFLTSKTCTFSARRANNFRIALAPLHFSVQTQRRLLLLGHSLDPFRSDPIRDAGTIGHSNQ